MMGRGVLVGAIGASRLRWAAAAGGVAWLVALLAPGRLGRARAALGARVRALLMVPADLLMRGLLRRQRIIYNVAWEDPRIDGAVLELDDADTVLVLSTGGCNVLDRLLDHPAHIVAVDFNGGQSALLELKLVAARVCDHPTFFALFASPRPRGARPRPRPDLRPRPRPRPHERRLTPRAPAQPSSTRSMRARCGHTSPTPPPPSGTLMVHSSTAPCTRAPRACSRAASSASRGWSGSGI